MLSFLLIFRFQDSKLKLSFFTGMSYLGGGASIALELTTILVNSIWKQG